MDNKMACVRCSLPVVRENDGKTVHMVGSVKGGVGCPKIK